MFGDTHKRAQLHTTDKEEIMSIKSGPDANSSPADSPKKRKSTLSTIEVDLSASEPPSKKARRALKKTSNSKTKVEDADQSPQSNTKTAEARSEHGVWIGNLPFTVTVEELRQWLIV